MIRRAYDAILLDLDGTLVDAKDAVHPRTLEALRAADAAGVTVMVATGRSETATIPVLETLGLEGPAVVFNGAGVWCPKSERLIEERVLADATVAARRRAASQAIFPSATTTRTRSNNSSSRSRYSAQRAISFAVGRLAGGAQRHVAVMKAPVNVRPSPGPMDSGRLARPARCNAA